MSPCPPIDNAKPREVREWGCLWDVNPMVLQTRELSEACERHLIDAFAEQGRDVLVVNEVEKHGSPGPYRLRGLREMAFVEDLAAVAPLLRAADFVVQATPAQSSGGRRSSEQRSGDQRAGEQSLVGRGRFDFEEQGEGIVYQDRLLSLSRFAADVSADRIAAACARSPVGLILAGGKSSRMGENKALLSYGGGKTLLEVLARAMDGLCRTLVISGQASQVEPYRDRLEAPVLVDAFQGLGPLGGILTAQKAFRGESLLVVASDLPGLSRETLEHLLANRDPSRFGTAFASLRTAGVEPLCAIVEPKAYGAFLGAVALDKKCPAKILSALPLRVLEQRQGLDDLRNINTPQERLEFLSGRG